MDTVAASVATILEAQASRIRKQLAKLTAKAEVLKTDLDHLNQAIDANRQQLALELETKKAKPSK